MLPSCNSCPTGNYDNVAQSVEAYKCWVDNPNYPTAYRDSKLIEASNHADVLMLQDYQTADKETIVGYWLTNPTDQLLLDGTNGYAHAALSLLELQTAKESGATDEELVQLALEQKAKWYLHEAKARCIDGVKNWSDPDNWYEDSKYDYYMAVLFIDWFLLQNNLIYRRNYI